MFLKTKFINIKGKWNHQQTNTSFPEISSIWLSNEHSLIRNKYRWMDYLFIYLLISTSVIKRGKFGSAHHSAWRWIIFQLFFILFFPFPLLSFFWVLWFFFVFFFPNMFQWFVLIRNISRKKNSTILFKFASPMNFSG